MASAQRLVLLSLLLELLAFQVLLSQCSTALQPRPQSDFNNSAIAKPKHMSPVLLVVQNQYNMYKMDSEHVKQPDFIVTEEWPWTVNHFLVYKPQPPTYWAGPCPTIAPRQDNIVPDNSLLEIWPQVFDKSVSILNDPENIMNNWKNEEKCVNNNNMYKKDPSCYIPQKLKGTGTFAKCYYKQIEQLFETGTGVSQEVPIVANYSQHKSQPEDVSMYVNKRLGLLFKGAEIANLHPDDVKLYTNGQYIYLGCQRPRDPPARKATEICTITRVGLCFQCYTAASTATEFRCTPQDDKIPGKLASCINVKKYSQTLPWADREPTNANKEYSCYDNKNCPKVQLTL